MNMKIGYFAIFGLETIHEEALQILEKITIEKLFF